MTTTPKDPRAVIEQLVGLMRYMRDNASFERNDEIDAAITAGHEALVEEREVGYGLYIALNGELRLEYPVEATYDDCALRLQEYEWYRTCEIRTCHIIPTGIEK